MQPTDIFLAQSLVVQLVNVETISNLEAENVIAIIYRQPSSSTCQLLLELEGLLFTAGLAAGDLFFMCRYRLPGIERQHQRQELSFPLWRPRYEAAHIIANTTKYIYRRKGHHRPHRDCKLSDSYRTCKYLAHAKYSTCTVEIKRTKLPQLTTRIVTSDRSISPISDGVCKPRRFSRTRCPPKVSSSATILERMWISSGGEAHRCE